MLTGLALAESTANAGILVNGGVMSAYAQDWVRGNVGFENRDPADGSSQLFGSVNFNQDLAASTTSNFALSNSGSQATIRFDNSLFLSTYGNLSQVYWEVRFTVSELTQFSISGAFQGSSRDSTERLYESSVGLGINGNEFVFYERDYDTFLPPPVSVAYSINKLKDGGFIDLQAQTRQTGFLDPGSYQFRGQQTIHSIHNDIGGDTVASGFAQLVLGPPGSSVVPEPTGLLVWSMLFIVSVATSRRLRKTNCN